MSATQDYVALEWIRGELANTLQIAQVALEAVAESPDDASSMRSCLSAIHQVHGTLKMVQLEGPTQVAAEMEQLAQSLMNNSVPELQLAQENLMQAILQLPAYLDRLHREQEDSERNYLRMVNNLRSARGEERLPGSGNDLELEVSGPDISPLTTPPADAVVNNFYQADGEGNLPKIRARYQQSLGYILKKSDIRSNLTTIGKLFTMLIRLCGKSPMGRLSELGIAVVEGIANGGIRLDKTSAGLLKKVDGALKQLAEAGQAGLTKPVDEELANGLIGLIHGAQKETKRIRALRALYAFESTNVHEQVSIGPDDETMSAVAKILIEEIREVTDKLDLYVRSQDRNVDYLVALLPNLEKISSTMVVLGSSDQQVTVAEQIDVIKAMGFDDRPDEETLLSMAQSLLQIEASLSALVIDSDDGSRTDDFANLDEAQAAVVRETRRSLALDKDAIIEFISADFDQAKLAELPDSLRALRGGLMIVNQTRAGDVLESAANYVTSVILGGSVTPELEQMDDLADAITSVDYYLERLLENAGDPYLQMLEVAETAVAKLGFAVGEEVASIAASETLPDEALHEELETPAEDLIEEDLEEPTSPVEVVEIEIELEVAPKSEPEPFIAAEVAEEIIEKPAAVELEAILPVAEDDLIDGEILEIFAEEAEEVLQTIGEFLPLWQSNPADEEALAEIRRAFHTLKGSGRMVGATVVGELGWSVENLLNRITDKTVEPSLAVMDILAEVITRIPEGVEAFKRGEQHEFKPQGMADIADALADGREPPAMETAADTLVESDSVEAPASIELGDVEGLSQEPVALEALEEPVLDAADDSFDLDAVDEIESELPEELPVQEKINAIEDADIEVSDKEENVFELEDVDVLEDISFEVVGVPEPIIEEPTTDESTINGQITEEQSFDLDDLSGDTEPAPDVEALSAAIDEPSEDLVSEESIEEDTLEDETPEEESFALDIVEDIVEIAAVDPAINLIEESPASGLSTADELLESDDLDLDQIFTIEANEKLEVIANFVNQGADVSGDVVAAFHTLKGSSAMAEIDAIASVAAPLEQLTNDYLIQNKASDSYLIEAASQAVLIIQRVLSDLSAYRSQVPGGPELIARIASGSNPQFAENNFDFQEIILLSEANIAADGWQDVEALIAEMKHADEQAITLDQPALSALLRSMLRVYSQSPGKPDDLTLSLMKRAHDHLVFMFDALASSQLLRPADRVIADLDAVVIASASALVTEETPAVGVESIEKTTPSETLEPALTELPADNIDEDILPIFLEESEELLEEVDQSILGWSESGQPGEH
ncbi:MAG: chemosensory pili system protein ChpA (sensor histidine kinase/response regulator), partial [Candidatus Azotimanducaceae bacterium]